MEHIAIHPDPASELALFEAARARDAHFRMGFDWDASWAHLTKRLSEGALAEMGFDAFDGSPMVERMIRWIDHFDYPCPIDSHRLQALEDEALARDTRAVRALGLSPGDMNLPAVARYSAQDFWFQREAVPLARGERLETVLDFGAGHGRQGTLWQGTGATMIGLDATAGPYLAQRAYARALGWNVADYLDGLEAWGAGVYAHLPSWRMDLIRDGSVDMILAVQVLREMTKPMLAFALDHFARVLRPGGRLYVRDHIGFHNVNAVDQDAALRAHGFAIEWRPHWVDRQDVHGVPRIWRKVEPEVVLGGF
ncbi:MAG: class I SAM-dependent methyltransferase [Pseudomonadota bacterium]